MTRLHIGKRFTGKSKKGSKILEIANATVVDVVVDVDVVVVVVVDALAEVVVEVVA